MAENLDLETWQKKHKKTKKSIDNRAKQKQYEDDSEDAEKLSIDNFSHTPSSVPQTRNPVVDADDISPDHIKKQYLKAMEDDEIIKILRSASFDEMYPNFSKYLLKIMNLKFILMSIIAIMLFFIWQKTTNIPLIIFLITMSIFIGFLLPKIIDIAHKNYPLVLGKKQFYCPGLTANKAIAYADIEYFTFIQEQGDNRPTKYLSFKFYLPFGYADLTNQYQIHKIYSYFPSFMRSKAFKDEYHIGFVCDGFNEKELIDNFSRFIKYSAPKQQIQLPMGIFANKS
ncbi:MAG: hypothetical protein ACK5LE_04210 [Alphaproteobacteria bacterium]